MQREDLSDKLVHLTKVDKTKWDASDPDQKRRMENEALFTLFKILSEKKLRSGNGMIKGGHMCVCFSETPLPVLRRLFADSHPPIKYRPFGVVFPKSFMFWCNARPVIYQPEDDYDPLPDDKKHLHMTFDLRKTPPVDFTWEREWRYRGDDGISLNTTSPKILVPNEGVRNLVGRYMREMTPAAEDPWEYIILDQYGLDVPVQEVSLPAM